MKNKAPEPIGTRAGTKKKAPAPTLPKKLLICVKLASITGLNKFSEVQGSSQHSLQLSVLLFGERRLTKVVPAAAHVDFNEVC